MTQPFDSDSYKASQRRDWSTAAVGWKHWWKTLEVALASVSQRMIELAEIEPGQHVLDVATGVGEPAVTVAGVVGPSGHVTATDIAPGMLEIARERAEGAALTNIDFVEMDAEAIEFPEDSFDVVLCRFGLMFLPNPAVSLKRMERALSEGGHLVASVWASPERAPGLSVTMTAVAQTLQLPAPPPGAPGLFTLGDRSLLEELLRRAGFRQVQAEPLKITMNFDSTAEYVRYLQDVAAPINNLLVDRNPEQRDEVWRAIAEANRQFEAADGTLRLEAESLLVVGRH